VVRGMGVRGKKKLGFVVEVEIEVFTRGGMHRVRAPWVEVESEVVIQLLTWFEAATIGDLGSSSRTFRIVL
jgi:hypothetical protein